MAAHDFWVQMLQHFGAIGLFAFALYMAIKRIGEPLVKRHVAFLDSLELHLSQQDKKLDEQSEKLDAIFRRRHPPFYEEDSQC